MLPRLSSIGKVLGLRLSPTLRELAWKVLPRVMCSCLLALRRIRKSDDQMRGKRRLVHHLPPSNVFISSLTQAPSCHIIHHQSIARIIASILQALLQYPLYCTLLTDIIIELHNWEDSPQLELPQQKPFPTTLSPEETFCSRYQSSALTVTMQYATTKEEKKQIIVISVLSAVGWLALAAAIAYTCVRHNKQKKREFQRQAEEATGAGESGQATGVVGADSAEP